MYRLRLPAATLSAAPEAVEQLANLAKATPSLLRRVEPDYVVHTFAVPNDPLYADGSLWGLHNTGQDGGTADADIDAPEGWDIQRTADSVVVGIIDTGVRHTHEDLAGNMWTNPGETGLDSLGRDKRTNGVDDDGNGYVDDVHGINAISGAGDPMDDNGHGTHVAGTIGARGDNGLGSVGVAWTVRLMGLKFLAAEGGGAISDALECLDYARLQGARITSNSWGGGDPSEVFYDSLIAARDADILFIVAAGNSASNNDDSPVYPSSYAAENVLSVASMNRLEGLSSFSNYGFASVHVAAPGSGIVSCYKDTDSTYQLLNGTSMATPHVSGLAALLRERFPSDNYRQIINRIHRSVDVAPAYLGKVQTNGRVNVSKALLTTKNTPANDDFAEPLGITGERAVLFTYNQGSTVEAGEPAHAGVEPARTLWFSYTAPFTGAFVITTNGSELESGGALDTSLAVYTGTTLEALTPVAANDDDGSKLTSRVRFNVTQGVTYRIAVGTKAGVLGGLLLSFARPPANDDFASAIALSGDSAAWDGSSLNSNRESGEPIHAGHPGGASIWFTWTAPQSAVYSIATVGGTYFDSLLAVYTGSSINALTLVAANDDYNAFASSRVTFSAVAGVTYVIAVDAKDAVGGTLRLTIGRPPLNDNFADAVTITGPLPAVVFGRNFGATIEPGEPIHTTREDVPASNSVWWKWTAPQSQSYQLSLDGSNFDSVLAVYTGSAVNALTKIGANDDFIGPLSFLTFTAVAGETYYIAVDGFSGQAGNIELRVLPPPVAMTNDYFADRIKLYGASISTEGSNIGAQHEYPTETIGAFTPYPSILENRTVWWQWTAPADGPVTIDTRNSSFDTALFVYSGNALNALTALVWNDDIGSENSTYYRQSQLTFTATRGTRYQIMVMGFDWTHFGSILLHINQTVTNQPPRILTAGLSATGESFADESLTVTGLTATDAEADPVTYAYQWQTSSDGGNSWTDRSGATSASITPGDAYAGLHWRCLVTPKDATGDGEPVATPAIAVGRRPVSTAVLGQAYSYQPGLSLPAPASAGDRKVMITEISQGSDGLSEWFEFLVLRPMDLRRYYFQTSTGGAIALTSDALWQNIPAGTLIVFYNAAHRDPALPPDDFDASDGRLVIPSDAGAYIRQDLGNATAWFYEAYPGQGSLYQSDAIRITDSRWNANDIDFPSVGGLLDGIQWGYFGNTVNADSPNVYVTDGLAPNQSLAFTGDSSAVAENAAAWRRATASAAEVTPGQPNTLEQSRWIAGLRDTAVRYRLAATSGPLPAGLTLDTATGLLSGTPVGLASQTSSLVIERYDSTQSVQRAFTLAVVAPGVSNATVYEPFNYTTGQSLVSSTATGTGLNGTWTTPNSLAANVVAGNLEAGGLPAVGGKFQTTASATADLYVPLSSAAKAALNPAANGSRTIWLSFAARVPAIGGQPGLHLARDSGTPIAGVRLTDASGRFVAIRNGAVTGTGTFSPSNAISVGTDYYVLARFVVTNASGTASDGWGGATPGTIAADVWVYPLASPPTVEPSGSGTANYAAQSDGTGTRYINGLLLKGSSAGSGLMMDEVRVGTTFAQVALNPVDIAPGNLVATVASSTQINLAWTDLATNETGYRVEHSAEGSSWATLATLAPNSTAFSDTSLSPAVTRFYRVCAVNASGGSGYAGPVFATTLTGQADWRRTHFGTTSNAGNAADAADPDGDGVPNLLEYALDGDPGSSMSAQRPAVQVSASALQIAFVRARSDVTYVVEASTDMVVWTEIATNPGQVGQAVTVSDTATISAAAPRRFLRVRVSAP